MPGAVTARLSEAYNQLVDAECPAGEVQDESA
jgi:hypothetical protein